MIVLSNRLRLIAEQVEQGSRLADIGSDHALLPAFLVEQGIVPYAVAGEYNPGPFEAAGKQVAEAGLTGRISVRRGNGFEVVQPGEVDTITIAGMGGNLIVEILSNGRSAGKLAGVRKLILQPNVGEEAVRRWLRGNSWFLTGETILEEDGKIYELLWAVPDPEGVLEQESGIYRPRSLKGFGTVSEKLLLQMGPYLMDRVPNVFLKKWERETEKLEWISSRLGLSDLEESQTKRIQLEQEINRNKELIRCLRKDKPSFN